VIERLGNIFDDLELAGARVVLIPTNGQVKASGEAVMGAGVALEAARRWPWVKTALGEKLRRFGNVPHALGPARNALLSPCAVLSFPTKNRWEEPASLDLIKLSAELTRTWVDNNTEPGCRVLLPRVGAGLGGLNWALVRAVLAPSFDDRFHVLTPPERLSP
jgi:hypothetical protein